jgi:transcription-repair coupling factor (superfamily II helicase)
MIKIEELDDIREEMTDRFGKPPVIVERLISAAVLRYYASTALLERIVIQKEKITVVLPKAEREDFYKNKFVMLIELINNNYTKDIKLIQSKEVLKLEIKNRFDSPEKVFEYMNNLCKNIASIIS